jgi:putative endonuclease
MRQRGRLGEDLAVAYLKRQGLELLARNYRCRYGEIDLIARDGQTLVFVEVRMRGSNDYGGAAASITAGKQTKLVRAARHFLAGRASIPPCRFDALLISGSQQLVEWIKNAFEE